MSLIAFYFKNAVYGLKGNKLLNLIVVLSISIGMMYPVIACTISERILRDAKLSEYMDIEHTSVLEFFTPYMEQKEIDKKIEGLTEGIDVFGYQAIYTVTAKWNRKYMVTTVAGYSSGFMTLEGNEILKGRLLTEDELSAGKPVCLVLASSIHNFKIGDSISFAGTTYEIVGMVYMPKSYGGILIPYNAMEKFIGKNNVQYKVTVHTSQIPNINEISKNLNFTNSILSIGTASENTKPYYESIWALIKERIGIGLIVLLFAVISMIMIIVGKTIDDQYMIGVKMSVGASGTRVFIETFLQNSILIIIALMIDFILFPIVKHNYSLVHSYPDTLVFIVMVALCLIISFFVSLLGTAFILKNKSISGLLKKLK